MKIFINNSELHVRMCERDYAESSLKASQGYNNNIHTKRALNMLHMRESPAGIIFANFSCDYFLPEAPFLESFQDGA